MTEPDPILSAFTLEGVADYIRKGSAKRIIVMAGAGMSTSAGIPDFRSQDSGLYAKLAEHGLARPEDIFDVTAFRENPRPFYEVAKLLYPGAHCPTPTHAFLRVLADRGLLLRVYTQNVDTLERIAGVPDHLLVEAHGSFHTASCVECHAPADPDDVRAAVTRSEVAHCALCDGVVKPDIVFFGEDLPDRFGRLARVDMLACDLLLVIGTSLSVYPFASLILRVPPTCPRVLINKDHAGAFPPGTLAPHTRRPDLLRYRLGAGANWRDVGVLTDCDSAVAELCEMLGWSADLEGAVETVRERFAEARARLASTARESGVDFDDVLGEAARLAAEHVGTGEA